MQKRNKTTEKYNYKEPDNLRRNYLYQAMSQWKKI